MYFCNAFILHSLPFYTTFTIQHIHSCSMLLAYRDLQRLFLLSMCSAFSIMQTFTHQSHMNYKARNQTTKFLTGRQLLYCLTSYMKDLIGAYQPIRHLCLLANVSRKSLLVIKLLSYDTDCLLSSSVCVFFFILYYSFTKLSSHI